MDYKEKEDYGRALIKIREYAEEVAGRWNGEDVKGEDKAHCATDIVEKIDELMELLKELDNY